MTRKLLLLGTVVGTLGFLTPAYADTIWDFGTAFGTGLQGVSKQYTGDDGTSKLTASGFQDVVAPNGAAAMNIKNLGTDEAGLGIAAFSGLDSDNEIIPGTFIQIQFNTPIIGATFSFQAQSVTDGDAFHVFGSNTAGVLGTTTLPVVGTGSNPCVSVGGPGNSCETLINLSTAGFSFIDVTADAGDVLLREINAVVPAPIAGAGLPGVIAACGGLIALARRRRKLVV